MIFRSLYLILFGLLFAFGASWLSRQDGQSTLTWLGYQIEVKTSYLVVAIIVLIVATSLFDRVIRAFFRWPSLFSQGWQARRRQRGEKALSLGFVALAAGDVRAASREARRAEKLLSQTVLTDLLSAQAAYAKGDAKAAGQYFKKLAADKDTAYFGQLGLMRLHQQAQPDTLSQQALTAAQKAFALEPASAEAAQLILKHALRDGQWSKAMDCLKVYLNQSGGQSSDELEKAKMLYAQLAVKIADDAGSDGVGADNAGADKMVNKSKERKSNYLDALREAPDFIPAHEGLVRLHLQSGDKKAAQKAADKAFIAISQVQTVRLVREARHDNDGQVISHLMKLAEKARMTDEAYLAIADFAIEVGIWASASQCLTHLPAEAVKTSQYYLIEAAIAKAKEDDEAHDIAMQKAARAPRAPQWQCLACGTVHTAYDFYCFSCQAPGQTIWQEQKKGALMDAS